MIFCDEPWYNEPGRTLNRSASMQHNRELQGHTVRHAMLEWLNPRADLTVWGDVVRAHFRTNAQAIQQTLGVWGFDQSTATQLTSAMRQLE